jgi:hypothetical protein
MEISEAELEAAIADTAGMPDPVIREALLNLIEKGLVVDSGMRRNGQWREAPHLPEASLLARDRQEHAGLSG